MAFSLFSTKSARLRQAERAKVQAPASPAQPGSRSASPGRTPAAGGHAPVNGQGAANGHGPVDARAAPKARGAGTPGRQANVPSEGGFKTTLRLQLSEEWSPRHSRIEVSDSAPGLTAVLENAALLFANGQLGPARDVLEDGIRNDAETQRAVLAWLALFDLLQRQGDRATFEKLALQFVVTFERSAPMWEVVAPAAVPVRPLAGALGPAVVLSGSLTEAGFPHFDLLGRKAPGAIRIDATGIEAIDDGGARRLAAVLSDVRRRRGLLQWQGLDRLRAVLEAAVGAGVAADEGLWILLLEVLQWQGEESAFEERAVEYAITFELSPPSWEPPSLVAPEHHEEPAPDDGFRDTVDLLPLRGVLAGPADSQIGKLYDFGAGRDEVMVDMSAVERIDFVCAGSLYNAIQQLGRRETDVHIAGASAIIRSLLLLIGIPPRHFAKRAQ